ncbi:hypothetical protein Tco_1074548, partial [Tanacetum coccineum]
GKPQQDDTGFIDSGCSRNMTGNIAYLLDFKEFDGGYVAFGGGAYGGRITALFEGRLLINTTKSMDERMCYIISSGPRCQDTILGDVDAQTRLKLVLSVLVSAVKHMLMLPVQVFAVEALSLLETHIVVVFLEKPEESNGFAEIIDFLKASSVSYALTVNPVIYTSCIEQFWATAKRAGKDFSGRITPLFDTMMVQPVEEIEVPQDKASHEESVTKPFNDLQPSGDDSILSNKDDGFMYKIETQFLILQRQRFEKTQESWFSLRELSPLKTRRVWVFLKMHPNRGGVLTDIDVELTLVDEIKNDDSTAGEAVTAGDDSVVPTTNEEITLAQTLIQIKAAKPKVVTTAATTATTTRPKDRGVVVQEPSEFRVPQEIKPSSSKDKRKRRAKASKKSRTMGSEVHENKEKKEEGREETAKGSRKKMLGRKRAGKEQQKESLKKQKVEEEKESEEVDEGCNALGYSTFRLYPDLGVLQIVVMSSASSAVTYTSVYPIQPVAPPSPDYIPGPEDLQTPLVPQDEDEQEYEDDETEDGPVDYPMDGGEDGDDDDGGSHGDDADDEDEDEEDEDEEEEEEHLASADSAVVEPTIELVSPPEGTELVTPPPSTDITTTGARITVRLQASIFLPPEAEVERLLAMLTPPPSPLTSLSPPSAGECLARIASTQALVDAVTAALPSPKLPPLPPSLYIPPPVDCRDDIPESEKPPRKSSCLFALGSRYEVRESSTARPTRGRGVDPAEAVNEIAPMTVEEVNTRVTELAELHEHDTQDLYALLEDAQDSRTRIS